MHTQLEKARAFRALHQRDQAFIIPNPWDAGTARLLAYLGFEALASTSSGFAASMGKRDYAVGQEAMIAHVSDLAAATDLPVSADLENGFADAPAMAAKTIALAAAAGVVGGSIEDATGRAEDPIYELAFAAERVRAAAEQAHSLAFPFTLTARAENYLHGCKDLKNTIERLQAYQTAGADVLYAPGLTRTDEIATLVKEVDRPVNVLMGMKGIALDLNSLSNLGVRRVSVGGALARAAMGAFLRAAHEMRDHGMFTFVEQAAASDEVVAAFPQ